MGRNLYVGNLPWSATSNDLQRLFSGVGICRSARILRNRETGHSRGFGFVEMASGGEADAAIRRFNGYDFRGRALRVMEARDWRDAHVPRGVVTIDTRSRLRTSPHGLTPARARRELGRARYRDRGIA